VGYNDEETLRRELLRLTPILEEITGLTSNWNGTVELIIVEPGSRKRAYGRKPFSCGIHIDRDHAQEDARWRTLIHESLHALSAGYNRRDYDLYEGWEEGVVEKTQQLLRPAVRDRLGISLSPSVFARYENPHPFQSYIDALETIRALLPAEPEAFYLRLLAVPLQFRPGAL
jgi:hypothetical protein